jgi:hypothetical protein
MRKDVAFCLAASSELSIVLLLISFTFTFNSCKKTAHTHIDGTIQDAYNRTLIAGANVYVAGSLPGCNSCGGPGNSPSTISDANGKYSIDFNAEKKYDYVIYAGATNYMPALPNGAVSINVGQQNPINIALAAIAYLKIHAKNTCPFDANDQIVINGMPDVPGNTINGKVVDTLVTQFAYGNTTNPLVWIVKKNNVKTSYSANVYCTPFDTTFFSINY